MTDEKIDERINQPANGEDRIKNARFLLFVLLWYGMDIISQRIMRHWPHFLKNEDGFKLDRLSKLFVSLKVDLNFIVTVIILNQYEELI